MSRSRARLAVAIAVALAAPACGRSSAPEGKSIKVAGASDLVFVMKEIESAFEAETGIQVTFIPGSSGKLATQIKQGAPFDVYLSANIKYVDDVIASGECLADTRALYAQGRLVIWTRPEAPPPPDGVAGLVDGQWARIAIANPEHAPYGMAAKQALTRAGVWDQVKGRLVYGSNIVDTMRLAESGNADVSLIALALAIKSKGHHVAVPQDSHEPIDQGMVACKAGHEPAARKFVDFMRSARGRDLLQSYGFGLPPP